MTNAIKKIVVIGLAYIFVALNRGLVYADGTPPVVDAVTINGTDTSISLTEGTTTSVVVLATVSDTTGCEDISGVSVKLFRTNVESGAACTLNSNNCYDGTATVVNDTCTAGGEDKTADYSATINVQYYADPTDDGSANATSNWTAVVTPTDGTIGTVGSDTIEMATTVALSVTASISFGSLALDASTTHNETTTITNTGNKVIGAQVSSGAVTAMTCANGTSIPAANEKFGLTDVDYGSLTNELAELGHTPAHVTGAEIIKAIDETTSTAPVYWGLKIPLNGVGGGCSGTIVFTPI